MFQVYADRDVSMVTYTNIFPDDRDWMGWTRIGHGGTEGRLNGRKEGPTDRRRGGKILAAPKGFPDLFFTFLRRKEEMAVNSRKESEASASGVENEPATWRRSGS